MSRHSFQHRSARAAVAATVILGAAGSPPVAYAGGVTGQATEWTQLANNAE
ncbi:MAG: conjugal transfer protein TrbJ, partial [Mesorhizobium sp.]